MILTISVSYSIDCSVSTIVCQGPSDIDPPFIVYPEVSLSKGIANNFIGNFIVRCL